MKNMSRYAKVYSNAHYGGGSTPVAMDGLSCVGTETDISYCNVEAWDSTNCTQNNTAGVACSEYELNLVYQV